MSQYFNTIPQLLKHNVSTYPSKTFLRFKDKQYTYLETNQEANKVANFLKTVGVKKGDHVALLLKNSPDFLFIWFGIAKLGAVMVPINYHIKGESLEYILDHSDSSIAIVEPAFVEQTKAVADKELTIISLEDIRSAKDLENTQRDEVPLRQEDPMSIIYTSGTTGLPKGVVLPHFSYVNTAANFLNEIADINEEDILYTCLPLFHCNAQQLSVMGTMLAGAQLALSEKFSASKFWSEIHHYQATIFNYIGSILTVLYKQPYSKFEINNTITKTFGGAAPKEIWAEFEDRFDIKVMEGFGLTETATVCLCNPTDDVRLGSIGKPLSNVEVKIFDENEKEAPPNTEGQICVRELKPHTIFKGYYKMPDKTEEAMKGGWFHTGDRGTQDENGYFYFKDRMKDCIRYRGENISSYEIERIINKHPDVKESAAIGVPSELSEEDVKVILVPQENKTIDFPAFIRYCEDRMAYYMVPRYVEIKDTLPKTATERVQKYELRNEGIDNAWDRIKEGIKLTRK
ncbi:ATP-dependent acyl-CoA ligase [Bacillus sp. FJAT-45350]|uniref:ATP-dependent acyl-CoA ligase n=1 Tax=Bacillus sp. FJAT-45350 TaxID=2011014 RepID=UPI0015CDE1D3|nr:ATP-dependent acyl-CoA ligase [Bacillus sp. FJAT-45350]